MVTVTAGCILICIMMIMDTTHKLIGLTTTAEEAGSFSVDGLPLLFINGLLYHAEQVMAILTNAKVPRLAFSVIDTLRRLTIVISSFVLYGHQPTAQSVCGTMVVMGGCVCFAVAQHMQPRQTPKGDRLAT